MKKAAPPQGFIPYGRHSLDEADIQAVVDVLRKGPIAQGPKIQEFETAVARFVGSRYAVAVSSGTAALHLASLAAGVTAGDEVITSPNTFVASANCALYAGGRPVFSDIHPDTLNIDLEALQLTASRLKRLKAIIPVHFAGLPCDMASIKACVDGRGVVLIEDAAHALGATDREGGRIGNCRHSDMTIFSFHPVKHIAAGEGGMITTNNPALYQMLCDLRTHGITKEPGRMRHPERAVSHGRQNPWYYEMQSLGFHYRMTDFQAALALSQMGKIDAFLERRHAIAKTYDEAFADFQPIHIPQRAERSLNAQHLYVVRIDFNAWGRSRADLMLALQERSIGTQVHYIPVNAQPYYQSLGYAADCAEANRYYEEALSLPMYYDFSPDQQDYVISSVKDILS